MPQLPPQPKPTTKTTTSVLPTKTTTPAVATQTKSQSGQTGGFLTNVLSILSNIFSGTLQAIQMFGKEGKLSAQIYTGQKPKATTVTPSISGGGASVLNIPLRPQTSTFQTQTYLPTRLLPSTPINFEEAAKRLQKERLFPTLPTSVTTPAVFPFPIESVSISPTPTMQTPTTTTPQKAKTSVETKTIQPTAVKAQVYTIPPQPTEQLLSALQEFLTSQQNIPISTNVPEGATTYVIKDPLGGSTAVFGHIIQPGETLSKIAKQYGVSIEELERLNKENKAAMKSRDLIIAGQTLHVPVKIKQPSQIDIFQKGFTTQLPKTVEDLNLQQQRIKDAVEKLKRGEIVTDIKPQDLPSFLMYLMATELQELNTKQQNLEKFNDPHFYQRQYQELIQQSGLPDLYQRYFDLNKILQSTREDVMKEAIAAGGIVTQSQVEEIVAWRQSLLRGEMQALADLIDMQERLIDKTMKYVEMDRNELRRYFDESLKITDRMNKLMIDFAKWGLDWYEEITKINRTKLTTLLNQGALADMPLEILAEYANPYSALYSGYTLEELLALRNVSELIRRKKEEEIRRIQEQIERAKRRLQLEQKRVQISEQRLKLQEEKAKTSKEKQSKSKLDILKEKLGL